MHVLSVLIPAFNEEASLAETVTRVHEALKRVEPMLSGSEIIVCDNNSTDRTGEIAQSLGCKVVFEPRNQIARARNAAAAASRGDWLLFVDADSWPSPELLDDAVRLMSQGRHVGCGSTIRIVDGPLWFKWGWESKNLSMRLFGWCPGGFIFCTRRAFEETGGFPEEYYIFEEAQFVRSLKKIAARDGSRFAILHKHPFCASGRKGRKYGLWAWVKTAIAFWWAPGKKARDKSFAAKWYDPRR